MDNRLAALLSIVPPKPEYDPVRRAIDNAATTPEVAAVLTQFASMPPSTGVLANPVRHQQTATCANASLDLSIRSFTVRGLLMEEDIVRGAAGPLEVIFVGLFGRLATADQMTLFANCLAHAFAAALGPDGRMPELARFITRFPDASPDIAMQHCASVRKAQRRSGGISGARPSDELLAEMIAVHMENAAVGAGASYMRSLLCTSPQMTASALVDEVDRFMADLHDTNPLHVCYSLVLRRAVRDTEARILDRFGALQVHHGSAGSNMVARYVASLHTRAVSDLFTAAQMTLDSARHFGAISDMSDFVRELERIPASRRDDAIRERMRRGDLPAFGHPEIAAAGRSNTVECDPRPALYLAPLFDAIDAGEVEVPDERKERCSLVQRMYQIALVEGLTKPGRAGQLRVAPNTDFGAWLVQEALGIEEPDRTLLSYVYRGFGWMMDVREQLQQPIIRPVIAPDPRIVPGPATDVLIPTMVIAVHDRLRSRDAFLRQ
jgi:citrate synthase